MNMDAINLIKMLFLSLFTFGSLIFLREDSLRETLAKSIVILVLFFIVSLTFSALTNGSSLWSQFWGAQGRNSGILTLGCFAIVFLVVAVRAQDELSFKIISAMSVIGLINVAYGLAQYLGKDPIDWRNPYSPIVGTLGNPNFISSHLGLVAGAGFISLMHVWKIQHNKRTLFSLPLIIEILLALFVIWKSLSIQGILVFAIIVAATLLMFIVVHFKNRILTFFLTLGSLSAGTIFAIGFYGKGPLAGQLYRESLVHRTNFWEAGVQMFRENTLSGVGVDQFGDFYREYRSISAVQLRGPAVTTDSAHNIPIDIASGGGIFPFLSYVSLQVLVLFLGMRMIGVLKNVDFIKIGVFGLWIGYQAQTLISINQIGVSIWGWILGGLVVALNRSSLLPTSERTRDKFTRSRSFNSFYIVILSLIGVLVALPPLIQDRSFRNALATQNGVNIIEASKAKPENPFFLNYASVLLNTNGYKMQALDLAKRAVEINPRNYAGWRSIMEITDVGSDDYLKSVRKLRELDPLNELLPKP